MRRVVVTGLGIVSSIGNSAEEVCASLKQGTSGIVAAPIQAEYGFRSRVVGKINLVPEEVIERKARRFMSDAAAFSYLAMEEAIRDSGLEQSDISTERTGLIVGSGGPSLREIVRAADITREKMNPKRIGATQVPKAMSSTCSAVLSTKYKIRGLSYSISSACATSAHCIGNATELIQWGKQDVMFAGGGEEIDWTLGIMFDAMGALSSKYNDAPVTASRAYDEDRDGFVISGGGGMIVLEEYEHAKARGANIYAEIVGYGATSDGDNMVAPSGEGAVRCMKMALEGVSAPLDYINPHATSTPVGDAKEIEALREVFGSDCAPISATKSLTGHALGAAGAHEVIYSLLMMKNNFICKSAHIQTIDPEIADMPIVRELQENVELNCILSNSFGFGGTNATLVMQRV